MSFDLSPHRFIDGVRQAEAFWFADRLQPRRQIDVVAVKVAALLDDFAEMEPDAKGDVGLDFPGGHRGLNGHAALDRGDCRPEFGKKSVPGQLDQPPSVPLESRSNQVGADIIEDPQGLRLVRLDHAGVADDVGKHRACQAMLGVFLRHHPAEASSAPAFWLAMLRRVRASP